MGVILGTAAYMAPEQAAGGTVDRRADIWSFGVVLYEMLTGRRLFEGETVSHVLAGVLKDAPDFSALPAATPERIVDLVRRCLRRKPRERLQSIGDARLVLEEVLADPDRDERRRASPAVARGAAAVAAVVGRSPRPALLAAGALRGALAGVGREGGRAGAPVHAALVAPGDGFGDTFALSPDGRRVVFEALDKKSGERRLWLRELAGARPTRLAATDGGEMPFWSPDGAQIAFFADGKLKRIDLRGGPAQTICDAPTPRGGTWGPDGRIVFAATFRDGLSIVAVAGGEPQPLTTLDAARNEKSHRFPVFLPGGERDPLPRPDRGGRRAQRPEHDRSARARERQAHPARRDNSSPLFAPGGQILFWREGTLLAQRFDAGRLALAGRARPVASPVAFTQNEQALAPVSNDGTLVYRGRRARHVLVAGLARPDGLGTSGRCARRELVRHFALSHDGRAWPTRTTAPGQGRPTSGSTTSSATRRAG